MARQLRPIKMENGEFGVRCPRCYEVVIPLYIEMLDGYNCPDCEQTIDPEQLILLRQKIQSFDENDEES